MHVEVDIFLATPALGRQNRRRGARAGMSLVGIDGQWFTWVVGLGDAVNGTRNFEQPYAAG